MSNASNYLESKIIRSIFKGESFPVPTRIDIGLHTSDPGDTGAGEVTLAQWPAYARVDAAKGGAVATGWTGESGGLVQNALQLLWPVYDGTPDLTITHWSAWDQAGNLLTAAPLATARTVSNGDVYVADAGKLTVQAL